LTDNANGSTEDAPPDREAVEEFGELIRYTGAGFVGGLAIATILDWLGFQASAWGQWLVRTIGGEGESVLEGAFSIRKWFARADLSLAQAYGWGKLGGLAVPWIIDGASRLAGIDVYGIGGFYIPYFYAMSDQMGGSVAGFLYFSRRETRVTAAVKTYLTNPVMVTGLFVVLAVPVGLLTARVLGFSPATQVRTALEVIAANLCWMPPLVGWGVERRRRRRSG
jgi:hypothetical protein